METLTKQQSPTQETLPLTKIAVAPGDGIGPEIMDVAINVLLAAGARIEPHYVSIGEETYLQGHSSGIDENAWDVIRKNKVLFKAPITTPFGSGYKSLNVTLRKSLGLFANLRPCRALHPYVHTNFPNTDVVIIRENEEDLYAGIEHRQTTDVVQCLKLITRPGCERIIRYAFEYARAYGRKKVTCMVKDNIMKLTDGLFHRVFNEIGEEYPEIQQEVQIIDIGTARLAANPENYDVIVSSNLYGDILSDVAAEVVGSVGLAGSANIGTECALFEAIHGSAPDIAGKNIANPSGLISAGVMMLEHLGQYKAARKVMNALLRTIEDGYHTADIYSDDMSVAKVGTRQFGKEVIARLGLSPISLSLYNNSEVSGEIQIPEYNRKKVNKELIGVDVFIDDALLTPDQLGKILSKLKYSGLYLKMITNRGVKVYPQGFPETFCTDHWRCRFVNLIESGEGNYEYGIVEYADVVKLLNEINARELDIIKTENLYQFDGVPAFSLGQGE